jgi:hypothetical protein
MARSILPESLSVLRAEIGRVQDAILSMGSVVASPGEADPGSGWGDGKDAIQVVEGRIGDLEMGLAPLWGWRR